MQTLRLFWYRYPKWKRHRVPIGKILLTLVEILFARPKLMRQIEPGKFEEVHNIELYLNHY